MREEIITRTLYEFAELTEQAQDKALEKLWDINVSYHDWWEFIMEDIKEFGITSGLDCRHGGEFDLDTGGYLYINNIGCLFSDLWKNKEKTQADYPDAYADVLEPFFKAFSPRNKARLLYLEKHGILDTLNGETSRDRRSARFDVNFLDYFDKKRHKRLCTLEALLCDAWETLIQDLEHHYLKMLRREYEYLTSREAIIESIEANEYEFLEDGSPA